MVLTLIATVSTHNAYAIEGDGTSHVEVDEYPFNITVEEGGSITIHNNGENTINFVSYGWFEQQIIPVNDAIALEFPVVNCGTTCFVEGMYYISDLNGGQQSTIEIVKPYVAPPPTYQTTKDGITTVDVFTIPFDVTITENGSVTVHNTDSVDHVVSHTGTTGTTKSGTFYEVIPAQQQVTIEFPITGSSIYESGVYAFEDTVTGMTGSITILPWSGSKQAIQDNTVTGVAEQVGIQESIVVVLTPENNTSETAVANQVNDLSSAPTVIADYTVLSLQQELVQSEKRLTSAIESVALLKIELDNSQQVIAKQKQDITALSAELESGLSVEEESKLRNTVSELNIQVESLSKENESLIIERDQWKQLSDNWYAVAQEQLRVMIDVLGL